MNDQNKQQGTRRITWKDCKNENVSINTIDTLVITQLMIVGLCYNYNPKKNKQTNLKFPNLSFPLLQLFNSYQEQQNMILSPSSIKGKKIYPVWLQNNYRNYREVLGREPIRITLPPPLWSFDLPELALEKSPESSPEVYTEHDPLLGKTRAPFISLLALSLPVLKDSRDSYPSSCDRHGHVPSFLKHCLWYNCSQDLHFSTSSSCFEREKTSYLGHGSAKIWQSMYRSLYEGW